MYIIETPFSHIPTAFGVALHNSATTVIKALATFATGKSSMDFPCRFFIFIDAWVVLAIFADRFCVAPYDRFFYF